ncbi:MAG: chemotaxis protein CheW [Gemmatimonadota bacterium]
MDSHLVFLTEGERFGLPANVVEEVIDAPTVRHLAGMPPHVAGVVFHRGAWLPAIDAAPRLGLQPRAARAAALVVRRGAGRFALIADHVLGIREWTDTTDLGVVTTDLGLVTPVDPNLLFRSDMNLDEEVSYMPATSTTVSIVVFRMHGEEFGTDISNVIEVLEYREPVHVPRAPDFIDGVVQVRDTVLPIIDLRKRMEIPVAPPSADTRIIVVLIDEERVGLLVDSVLEVLHMSSDNVAQPPTFFRGLAAEYLQGLARVGERLVIVLRLERILTSQERIALLRADFTLLEPDEPRELTTIGQAEKKRGRRSKN